MAASSSLSLLDFSRGGPSKLQLLQWNHTFNPSNFILQMVAKCILKRFSVPEFEHLAAMVDYVTAIRPATTVEEFVRELKYISRPEARFLAMEVEKHFPPGVMECALPPFNDLASFPISDMKIWGRQLKLDDLGAMIRKYVLATSPVSMSFPPTIFSVSPISYLSTGDILLGASDESEFITNSTTSMITDAYLVYHKEGVPYVLGLPKSQTVDSFVGAYSGSFYHRRMHMPPRKQEQLCILAGMISAPTQDRLFSKEVLIADVFFVLGYDFPRECIVPGHFIADVPCPLENDEDISLLKRL